MEYILSIDQSTSGTKGLVWDSRGKMISRADLPHKQITNEQGWVGHDLLEIYQNTVKAAAQAIRNAGLQPEDIAAAGISNQRETAACWRRDTGEPLYHAVVWQCSRAADIVEELERNGLKDVVFHRTGLNLSPYFSGAKFGWMVKHIPAVADAYRNNSLYCGTIDSWLVYKLTGEFKTDYSNASRTQLLNLDTLKWDMELAEAFGIKMECLPEICYSDSLFGMSDFEGLFPYPIPIHGVLGDSHASLLGNRCMEPYTAKATYGTGSSVMMNAGIKRPKAGKGVVTSLAWGMNGKVEYVVEGNINYTGAVIQWLVADMGILSNPYEASELASSVKSTGGVYLVPAFSGLGAPYFNDKARAAIIGMNRTTKKAHVVRAAEECIAFQIKDVVDAINACIPEPITLMHADGGASKDFFLMQFRADILDVPLEISDIRELSGAGAAYCACTGAGISTLEDIFSDRNNPVIVPGMNAKEREQLYAGWKNAIEYVNHA